MRYCKDCKWFEEGETENDDSYCNNRICHRAIVSPDSAECETFEVNKKTLNFLWAKRLTFCLICPKCNALSGCYSIDELFINQKNGEECGNCGAEIPIVEANIQYAELK